MKPILNQTHGTLGQLLENAQFYQALLEVGQDTLPVTLRPHLIGVSFEEHTLILHIDHNIWATQLRFYEPTLLGIFQEHFPHLALKQVKIKTIPQPPPPPKKWAITSYPSKQDALEMQKLSEKMPTEGLKKALQKLSQLAQKNP